ncbi:hypothetical protein RB195_017320 [Necator americanus]|uniref:7TM GPCR serpentine receptor class x (Srx) domain-containing protein n=1 Tax=Necator americanus TaxID=51031 RepID=A0ABR1C8B5_NECAM
MKDSYANKQGFEKDSARLSTVSFHTVSKLIETLSECSQRKPTNGHVENTSSAPQWVFFEMLTLSSTARHCFVIIQNTVSLAKLPVFRIMQHASIACSINLLSQIIAAAVTIPHGNMNYTFNSINGAIFQGSWAVEYPMILVVAVKRFLAIALPIHARLLSSLKISYAIIACCWIFGAFNAALCLSGQVQTIWDAYIPGFFFTARP